jgi:hypothetical protein
MARQVLTFSIAVAVVLSGWALYLLIEENVYGHAVTLVGVVMLVVLFVWNGQRDPDRNQPKYGEWFGGGGGG